jgi:hypothetical protein
VHDAITSVQVGTRSVGTSTGREDDNTIQDHNMKG